MIDVQPPLSSFSGTLRQITPDSLNGIGATVLRVCAPLFAPADEAGRALAWQRHVERHGVDPNVNQWYVPSRPGRRFSGDIFPDEGAEYRLNGGCYHTVCRNAEGDDFETLVNELNAYRDSSAEFYTIFFDCLGPMAKALGIPRTAHIGVLVYPSTSFLHALPDDTPPEARTEAKRLADSGDVLGVTLGCVLSSAQIDGVLDLRLRVAQDWFFRAYVPKGPFPTDAHDFAGILPELTKLDLGSWSENNRRTHAIGLDLRRRGLAGLIYPSARSNCFVKFEDDGSLDFGGWTLVRYDNSPSPRERVQHQDTGGWLTVYPQELVKLKRFSGLRGQSIGWQIQGLMDLNMANYEAKMSHKGLSLKSLLKSLVSPK